MGEMRTRPRRTGLRRVVSTRRPSALRVGSVAAVAVLALAAFAGTALADQSYTDPTGDAGPGTDITGITARNDAAGLITIQVGAANPIVANHAIAIFIDADRNQATGDDGDEYWMYGGPATGVGFFNCTSGSCAEATPGSFSVGAASGNVTEFRVSRADLGNATGFNFVAVSISFDGSSISAWDGSPDRGYHSYDLAFAQCANGKDDDGDGAIDANDRGCSSVTDDDESDDPVTLRAGKASVEPLKPKAGTRVVVSVPITRVEAGAPLDSGTVACAARAVGGKAFRGAGRVSAGRAVCTFKVPLTAKGRVVRGTVTVVYRTATARAPFSFRVT